PCCGVRALRRRSGAPVRGTRAPCRSSRARKPCGRSQDLGSPSQLESGRARAERSDSVRLVTGAAKRRAGTRVAPKAVRGRRDKTPTRGGQASLDLAANAVFRSAVRRTSLRLESPSMRHPSALILTFLACGSACAGAAPPKSAAVGAPKTGMTAPVSADPYPSTYRPLPSEETLIRGATILTAAGPRIEHGSVLLRGGKVEAVGASIEAPAGATVIDAMGKWVTPGVIDVHSHLGVYPSPGVEAKTDGNEMTDPVTADVQAEHSLWPQDPQFPLALAGGVTSMLILPGSANLIGGVGVAVKNVPARTMQEMKFPGAPYALKMACGENPKRTYGSRGRMPMTRMGNIAVTREAWIGATEYRKEWQDYK